MVRYLYIIILIFIACGCYQNEPEPTFEKSLVLPRDSMVILLTDLQLADGAVNIRSKQGKPKVEYASSYTNQVLEKHGVSREAFLESMRYYSYNIEELDKIYEEVINRLGKLESEIHSGD
jgi:hypothetical protein